MGISRDSTHKRRKSGGIRKAIRNKRKFEAGRPPANTRIGPKRVRATRVRGGNNKWRALRLEAGNYSWGTESVTRKCRILRVVYNSTNNELVRTNSLVKGCIVQIDATPFRQWYAQHYGVELGKKKDEETKISDHVARKQKKHASTMVPLDSQVADQFNTGLLYACLSSRPGQSGRADGYILEGPELDFYIRKLKKK
eukprot:CAMPEP_0174232942 /NCGR_PEP_ID=MMETSP0417-20130205/3104_1 /TAXON_ID=242541 /ORGANISM="Mayorella sp, Strain BSH-02190019" /LENGTH=196 /DNA_ID=CAMNT_0015311079 /DNA_START=89 /DNA_END=679 /DNA_ORIENTATION=+